jgi:VIT1/CCC1 family predicted Fe2+/Mn2+ transporter
MHVERHFKGGATVRDVVIGMSDGLTVPFALAAGLSGAIAESRIVLTAGLAEVAAGSIAMGLGGYLAARGEAEHYASELERERREVRELPEREEDEVAEVFGAYGLEPAEIAPILAAFKQRPEAWVEFMMRFELGLARPEPGRAWRSALVIALSYVVGGLLPLGPYALVGEAHRALWLSAGATLVALLVFGAVKARFTGAPRARGAAQTALVGSLSAGAAYAIARLVA